MRKVLIGLALVSLSFLAWAGAASAASSQPSVTAAVAAPLRGTVPVTLLYDNSEGGQKWDSSSSGWTVTTDRAYSPSHSVHAPELGSPMLIYGPFDLSQATAATLSFELWYDSPTLTSPPSSTTCGAFLIGYSTDGSQFSFPTQWSGSTGGDWQAQRVDLGSWDDQASQTTVSLLGDSTVWIALSSSVTSTLASTTEGTYVDDLTLSATVDDTTPPTTSVVGLPDGWTNQPVTLGFTATDNSGGSGVAYTEYSTDAGKDWTEGNSLVIAAPADHAGDGVHAILYRSVDLAGNTEIAKSCDVKIDTRRPTTKAPKEAYVARGQTVHLRYTVADPRPGSPTADVTIDVQNGAGKVVRTLTVRTAAVDKALTASFTVPHTWKPGAYRFSVLATDQAGNTQTLPAGANKLIVRFTDQELATILAKRLARHSGNLAVGVIDRTSGAQVLYEGAVHFHTASIVKADILATLLLHHQATRRALTAAEKALATRMIEHSDNDAATALWDEVGGAPGVAAANVRLGLRHTVMSVAWGLTGTTASDQLALLSDLVSTRSPLSAASQSYELGLMRHVEPDQAWGVTAAATPGTPSAVKNGWLPDPNLWVINSIGVIHNSGHVLLVAVLSNDQPGEGSGIAQDEAAALSAVHVATALDP